MSTTNTDVNPAELARAAEAAIARAVAQSDFGAMRAELAQAGLFGVMAAIEDGGLGLDLAFALPIAEAAGRLRLPLPLAEHMLLAHAFAGTPQGRALAAGEVLGSIVWQGSIQGGSVRLDRGPADWILVYDDGRGEEPQGGALLDVSQLPPAEKTVQASLDPENPQVWIMLRKAPVLARLDLEAYEALERPENLLLAQTLHGAAEGALQAAADYMTTRVQFGRPLSSRQAVRHHLARMRLLQEVSSAAIQRAMACDEFGDARDTVTVLAGAIANAAFVVEKAIHLHGGMGFTWELPLHRSLRMIRKIDAKYVNLMINLSDDVISSVARGSSRIEV